MEVAGADGSGAMYDAFAGDYERHAADSIYNALYDRPTVLELLGDVGGRRLLDAGCGPGLHAEELLARGADVTAIDTSEEMVDLARQRLGDRAVVRRHDLARPLDWIEDGSFDFVLMALVIHHLDDRMTVLRESHRVLEPHGRLVISTHHPMTDWLRLGGSYFDVKKIEEVWKGSWHLAYWRQPLTDTCEQFLRAGFVIERIVEPRPGAAIRERDPEEYAELTQRPAFIAFRLRKATGPSG